MSIDIADYVSGWTGSPFGVLGGSPWDVTSQAPERVAAIIQEIGGDYDLRDRIAAHITAVVEPGATVRGPAIIGPRCFISGSALLRGGVFLDEDCIVGPAVELKSAFLFRGSKVAHLSFVGDSILGADVNLEAGSIVANYRNELEDKRIRIGVGGRIIDTGVDKFGALIGDGSRIGANAVIAPGAILPRKTLVARLALIDQHPTAA
jgi:UDP-N-acetylglucosamine diphosphorylase / glucose-1-phosphate thymidylyltransferase / UDP-N-acetylgalactosamine diphosphorylase / glucosamine-1-phosphate N-acetyltransferase / galactosamine-1-phosphate N-acetyltransferase